MSNDIFKQNPGLKEVFITSDNTAFFTQNSAENHAKTLKDKTVKQVVNPSKKVAIVEGNADNNEQKSAPKLSPKQQAVANYVTKFGKAPYDEATKAMIEEAIEKNTELVKPEDEAKN